MLLHGDHYQKNIKDKNIMKRCCRNCYNSREITFSDRMKRHIWDDFRLIICKIDGSVHRQDKEQRHCINIRLRSTK